MHITKDMNMHRKEWLGRCFGKKYGKDVSIDNEPCKCYEFGGSEERLKEIENNMKRWFIEKVRKSNNNSKVNWIAQELFVDVIPDEMIVEIFNKE